MIEQNWDAINDGISLRSPVVVILMIIGFWIMFDLHHRMMV